MCPRLNDRGGKQALALRHGMRKTRNAQSTLAVSSGARRPVPGPKIREARDPTIGKDTARGDIVAILGKAALAVWLECLPEAEEDFDRWYREEHLAERMGVPGFLRARRHQAVRGAPKYFAFYEVEDAEVLRSPTYLERLNNPTEWTRRVMPTVRNFTRGVYRRHAAAGAAAHPEETACVATLRLYPSPGREDTLRARWRDKILAGMAAIPGVRSAALFEADASAPGGVTVERRLIGATAEAPPFFCLCELEDPDVADRAAWRALLAPEGPAPDEPTPRAVEGVYSLLHSLVHPGS